MALFLSKAFVTYVYDSQRIIVFRTPKSWLFTDTKVVILAFS